MLSPIAASAKIRNDVKKIGARQQRHRHERHDKNDADPDAILPHRKHRHVAGVIRLELAGFAIEHVRVPSMGAAGGLMPPCCLCAPVLPDWPLLASSVNR
jgi:hypothetical protein